MRIAKKREQFARDVMCFPESGLRVIDCDAMCWRAATAGWTHEQMKPRTEALSNYFVAEEWLRVKT